MQTSIEFDEEAILNAPEAPIVWYIEGYSDADKSSTLRVVLGHFPFHIGRSPGLSLTLGSSQVSKRHATIDRRDAALWLHDLGSKNGTGVNGRRITHPVQLQSGDQIQIGQLNFHIGTERAAPPPPANSDSTAEMRTVKALLSQVLESGDVVPHYQPIVRLSNGARLGYEVLARTNTSGSQPASVLFYAAKQMGVEAQVSDLCRREGLRQGRTLPGRPTLFVNTHTTELAHVPFLESLRNFRDQARVTPIVLEIQEAQVRDLSVIRDLALVARAYGLKLAFDNFGGSETRLRQLLDFLPDYVKFDYSLIHGVDRSPQHRQRFVSDLVRQTRAAGSGAIAEGVETREEFYQCRQLGFDFAQGLFIGRPMCGADLYAATLRTELHQTSGSPADDDWLDQIIQVRPRPADERKADRLPKARKLREAAGRGPASTGVNSHRNAAALKSPRSATSRDGQANGTPRKVAPPTGTPRRTAYPVVSTARPAERK